MKPFSFQLGIPVPWRRFNIFQKVIFFAVLPISGLGFILSLALVEAGLQLLIRAAKIQSRSINLTLMLIALSVYAVFSAWSWWGVIAYLQQRVFDWLLFTGTLGFTLGYVFGIICILEYTKV